MRKLSDPLAVRNVFILVINIVITLRKSRLLTQMSEMRELVLCSVSCEKGVIEQK